MRLSLGMCTINSTHNASQSLKKPDDLRFVTHSGAGKCMGALISMDRT